MKMALPNTDFFRGARLVVVFMLSKMLLGCNALCGQTVTLPLDGSVQKVIVLVHGWIPLDGVPQSFNAYEDGQWPHLVDTLISKLQDSDWKLATYHWEQDAATGKPLELQPSEWELDNFYGYTPAMVASTYAYHRHGYNLGTLLNNPNLRMVHFIAHSAGSWAARQAMEYLLANNPYVVVQMTLLDPFIPGEAVGGYITSLDTPLMSATAELYGESRIYRLENYFAIDTPDNGYNMFKFLFPTFFTQETFSWRSGIDVNQQLDYSFYSYYDYHSGPIEFYDDSIIYEMEQYIEPDGKLGMGPLGVPLTPFPYFNGVGYTQSLHFNDLVALPRILQQPSPTTTVNAGESVNLSVSANRAVRYQWYKDETLLSGKTSSTLSLGNITSTDAGEYVVQISNDNNNGRSTVFSATATVQVTSSLLSTPTNLSASAVSSSQINLTWSASSGNPAGYRVERRQGSGDWVSVGTRTATNFSDMGLSASTNYTYRVLAYNGYGESSWSSTASATTQAPISAQRTLSIQSTTPVYINLTTDQNNLGDGTTPLTRTYINNKQVGLVAPETASNGQVFQKWQRNGSDYAFTKSVWFNMDADYTLTAVYATSQQLRTLSHITINGAESLPEGTSQSYTATAYFSDSSTLTITPAWSVGQSGIPASIGSNGVLTAGQVNANSIVSVQASHTDNGITLNASKQVLITDTSSSGTYTLSTSITGQGHIGRNPPLTEYTSGSTVRLSAVPETNYRFTGWGGDAASYGTTSPINITMNRHKNITANFVYDNLYFGPVTVTIQPAGAAASGAQWRLGNGPWQSSGTTVIPDSNGDNVIFFSNIPGYTSPTTQQIRIVSGQHNNFTGTYVSQLGPGGIQVTLHPQEAVAAGAQWRPQGGSYAWQNSGATLQGLPGGVYAIEFSSVPEWSPPATQNISVNEGKSATSSAYYLPPIGAPLIYSVTPTAGPSEGGTVVTIDGANFSSPATVHFGETPASVVQVISPTKITAVTPSHAEKTTSVSVFTNGGQVTEPAGFTYGPKFGTNMQLETTIGGEIRAVDILDNRAYVGQGAALLVLDVTNKSNPIPLGKFVVNSGINDIKVFRGGDNHIYAAIVANGSSTDGAVYILDVTAHTEIRLIGSLSTGGAPQKLSLLGGLVYVAGEFGLIIVNIIDPSNPVKVADIGDIGYASGLLVEAGIQGIIAYVSTFQGYIKIIDVSDTQNIILKSEYNIGHTWSPFNYGIAKKSTILYFDSGWGNGQMISVENLTAPFLISYVNSGIPLVQGTNLIRVARAGGVVSIFNINNPNSPQFLGETSYLDTYSSSPRRAVVSNNYVFIAEADQLRIVNINNPQSPIAVSTFVTETSYSERVFVLHGDAALVTSNNLGTYSASTFFSVSSLTNIYRLSSINSANNGFQQNGNLLFGTNSIIDITNINQPIIRSRFREVIENCAPALHGARPIWVGPNESYSRRALHVVDVTNPLTPTSIGSCTTPSSSSKNGIVRGNRAFFTFYNDGLRIYNLSNQNNPVEAGSISIPQNGGLTAISEDGTTAYVVMQQFSGFLGIQLVDVSGPQPILLGQLLPNQYVSYATVTGNRMVVAAGSIGVIVFDITNPRDPLEIARYNTPGYADHAVMVGDRVYVADRHAGVTILTMQDVELPSVLILNPVFSPTYSTTNATLTLGGTATDNEGISRMVWSNNRGGAGEIAGTDSWVSGIISLYPGENSISVTAFDTSGNTGVDMITVTYTPNDNTPPIVNITYPNTSGSAMSFEPIYELRGVASDNTALAQISWTNSRGGSGIATGKEDWIASDIPLQEGQNLITVTATDYVGITTSTSITVAFVPPDVVSPLITISYPTLNPTYETLDNQINISGYASDNRGVARVTWSNDRGGSGTASGAAIWSVNDISLSEGVNVISVFAEDEAGNQREGSLLVTRQSIRPREQWWQDYFGINEQNQNIVSNYADPDSDGLGNLAEYAFARNPLLSETEEQYFYTDTVDDYLSITYIIRRNLDGVVVWIEESDDLVTWHQALVSNGRLQIVEIIPLDEESEQVTVRLTRSIVETGALYTRFRVAEID